MKLLILTQKIDRKDGVLGFFHHWVEKMSEYFDFINVICLEQGETILSDNVRVWSLGKERNVSRLEYLRRFFWLIWQLRREYDGVFVHMNREYVLLGGWLWHWWSKKIVLWYNHKKGNFFSCLAGYLANEILFTSNSSFFVKWKKAQQMPAGIDTDIFKNTGDEKINKSILYLGRIDAVKNVDVLISAIKLLDQKGSEFEMSVYGEPSQKNDPYFLQIKNSAEDLIGRDKIKFCGQVANHLTPRLYSQHELYVNLTNSGSLDKTILEAMACESLVLVSNNFFRGILPEQFLFSERSAAELVDRVKEIWQLSELEKQNYGASFGHYVVNNHSLDLLLNRLTVLFNG